MPLRMHGINARPLGLTTSQAARELGVSLGTVNVEVFAREELAAGAKALRQAGSRRAAVDVPETRTTFRAAAALLEQMARGDAALVLSAETLEGDVDDVVATAGRLVESLTPQEPPVPSEAMLVMARRNARARWELLEETGYLTAEQIAEGRSNARNRAAYASRLRKQRRLFAVPWHGRTLYPAFQLDHGTGEPRTVVRDVLAALPVEDLSDWEVALWWTAANGWLDGGERPLDWIDRDPDFVVEAAQREREQPPA